MIHHKVCPQTKHADETDMCLCSASHVDGNPNDCPVSECMTCSLRYCPHGEPLHFHHDGCPACIFYPEHVSLWLRTLLAIRFWWRKVRGRCPVCNKGRIERKPGFSEFDYECQDCGYTWP